MITVVEVVIGDEGALEEGVRGIRGQSLKVVDNSADGLDVGVLGLPLVMAAVVATLHDVHATTEVWLLIHHPAEDGGRQRFGGFITYQVFINLCRLIKTQTSLI